MLQNKITPLAQGTRQIKEKELGECEKKIEQQFDGSKLEGPYKMHFHINKGDKCN